MSDKTEALEMEFWYSKIFSVSHINPNLGDQSTYIRRIRSRIVTVDFGEFCGAER